MKINHNETLEPSEKITKSEIVYRIFIIGGRVLFFGGISAFLIFLTVTESLYYGIAIILSLLFFMLAFFDGEREVLWMSAFGIVFSVCLISFLVPIIRDWWYHIQNTASFFS